MEGSCTETIINSFTSFTKSTYSREEQLPELKKLEREIVEFTFKNEDADCSKLTIRDAEDYLEKRNEELGNPASEEFQRFVNDCIEMCTMTKGIISGYQGEQKVFAYLNRIEGTKKVLKNVELDTECSHTELDAVVITRQDVTIVEVKNTKQRAEIDENGDFCKIGKKINYDSNLKEKMTLRKELIQNILQKAGYETVSVRTIVVFTKEQAKISNKCKDLTVCKAEDLLDWIGSSKEPERLSEADLEVISIAINSARKAQVHSFDYDAETMKKDFAELIVKLEQAAKEKEAASVEEAVKTARTESAARIGTYESHKSRAQREKGIFRPLRRRDEYKMLAFRMASSFATMTAAAFAIAFLTNKH